jgi:multidrug efflux pump subunit AcrA (membrane-fusion protein)
MTAMMQLRFIASLIALSALGLCGPAFAHGDEDHSEPDKPVAANVAVANNTAGTALEAAATQRLPDGSLLVPKAVQRQLGLRTVLAQVQEVATTVEFNGRVVADANAGGRVQASQTGRIEAGPKGLPSLGQKVSKGQVLAYLRPSANSIDRGNSQAQWAELESQLAIAERKLQRYQQLVGSVPQSAIEAARLERDALQKRSSAVGAGLNTTEALVAPVAGVISAAHAALGQVVDAKDVLFEVVDPMRLNVEALAYDAALVDGLASASAQVPGGVLDLQFVGGARQLREQAIPLLFRVKAGSVAVAVGQPVKVIAKTTRTTKGALVPQAALVKGAAGEASVWVHGAPERFVLRKVTAHAIDGANVAITVGIASGERVVTEGAGLLSQVR